MRLLRTGTGIKITLNSAITRVGLGDEVNVDDAYGTELMRQGWWKIVDAAPTQASAPVARPTTPPPPAPIVAVEAPTASDAPASVTTTESASVGVTAVVTAAKRPK
jgi:hypothetical protein